MNQVVRWMTWEIDEFGAQAYMVPLEMAVAAMGHPHLLEMVFEIERRLAHSSFAVHFDFKIVTPQLYGQPWVTVLAQVPERKNWTCVGRSPYMRLFGAGLDIFVSFVCDNCSLDHRKRLAILCGEP
jgi:hypothetical protein